MNATKELLRDAAALIAAAAACADVIRATMAKNTGANANPFHDVEKSARRLVGAIEKTPWLESVAGRILPFAAELSAATNERTFNETIFRDDGEDRRSMDLRAIGLAYELCDAIGGERCGELLLLVVERSGFETRDDLLAKLITRIETLDANDAFRRLRRFAGLSGHDEMAIRFERL
jgi:hypothetical protein